MINSIIFRVNTLQILNDFLYELSTAKVQMLKELFKQLKIEIYCDIRETLNKNRLTIDLAKRETVSKFPHRYKKILPFFYVSIKAR